MCKKLIKGFLMKYRIKLLCTVMLKMGFPQCFKPPSCLAKGTWKTLELRAVHHSTQRWQGLEGISQS